MGEKSEKEQAVQLLCERGEEFEENIDAQCVFAITHKEYRIMPKYEDSNEYIIMKQNHETLVFRKRKNLKT